MEPPTGIFSVEELTWTPIDGALLLVAHMAGSADDADIAEQDSGFKHLHWSEILVVSILICSRVN